MKIIIHKGSQEIGGNCISLTEADTTIWLDFGLPLSKGSECKKVSEMKPHPNAVFLSHAHLDHYGRIKELNELDSSIPVYMSKLTHDLINALCDFNSKQARLKNPVEYFKAFANPVRLGPFEITAWPVDHSAPDAYAFEICAGGKTVFYSGDLRAHGRMHNAFRNLIQRPPRNVDLMFLEGTMFGRPEEKVKSEFELELEMAEIFKRQTNISFVVTSGQNIDRIVTTVKAANRAKKTTVVGIYNAWIMEQFYKDNPDTGLPCLRKFEDMEVFFEEGQIKILEAKKEYFGDFYDLIHKRHAFKKRSFKDYVMITAPNKFYSEVIKRFASHSKVNVIFSMWKDYLIKPEHLKKLGFQAIAQLKKHPRIQFHEKHTSGHASIPDLQELVSKIKPQKLCPLHTDKPELFPETFQGVKILLTKDGEVIEV